MSKCLLRDQYYSNQDLQNLFSRLGVEAGEVISQEFDYILGLVDRRFRKLSLKCHPDKESDKEKKKTAEEKFKKLDADKTELKEYLHALKEGKDPSKCRELSRKEAEERQRKIDEILLRKSKVINRAILYFLLANLVMSPSLKVESCLLQLAANGSVQNIAYQFYAFSIGIWPWLFLISFGVVLTIVFREVKPGESQEENIDRLNRRINMFIRADNAVICIASMFAICSLASEIVQNGWPAQYGTMLMTNLILDLLFVVLFRTFVKASELYSEYCIQRLYEEDVEFSYKEKFAYPCKAFVQMLLPIVKMCFEDLVQEKPKQHTDEPKATPLNIGIAVS